MVSLQFSFLLPWSHPSKIVSCNIKRTAWKSARVQESFHCSTFAKFSNSVTSSAFLLIFLCFSVVFSRFTITRFADKAFCCVVFFPDCVFLKGGFFNFWGKTPLRLSPLLPFCKWLVNRLFKCEVTLCPASVLYSSHWHTYRELWWMFFLKCLGEGHHFCCGTGPNSDTGYKK